VTASDEGVEFLQEPVPPDETRHGPPLYLGARVDQWHILMTRTGPNDSGRPGLAAKLDEELDWTGLAKFLGSSALGK
jgi:hypothetical protein